MIWLILLALVVCPAPVTYALRKTPVFWAPAAALLIFGSSQLGTVYGLPDRPGVNLPMYASAFCSVYALACLVAALTYRRAARRRLPTVELPPAGVVRDRSGPDPGHSGSSCRNAK
jgi:hypothetical protein